jgi:hypothetical protein
MDLFVVPTIGFRLLYAFAIIRLDRRDVVRINVTTNPTAEWVARQITEAFPWNEAPRYMIRDRDQIYVAVVTRLLRAMGIWDRPTAPASPWQNGYAERLIGSIRRECLDHVIVWGESHLRRILRSYASYHNNVRTHRSLEKDAPISRPIQRPESTRHARSSVDLTTTTSAFNGFRHTQVHGGGQVLTRRGDAMMARTPCRCIKRSIMSGSRQRSRSTFLKCPFHTQPFVVLAQPGDPAAKSRQLPMIEFIM